MIRLAQGTIAVQPLLSPGLVQDARVATTGHILHKSNWVHHRFTVHAVGFVVRGAGSYAVGTGAPERVEPGTMFAVYPGPVFHYGPDPGTTWEEYYLTVIGNGVRRWQRNKWLFVDGTLRRVVRRESVIQLWQELMLILNRGELGDADRSTVVAERLLVEAYYGQVAHAVPVEELSRRVQEYCQANSAGVVDFERLARSFGVSYSLLRKRMKQATGEGPAHYLARVRCDRARALLAQRELSVQEVAAMVGMPDPFSFSRAFKRAVGVAPRHYREQMLGG